MNAAADFPRRIPTTVVNRADLLLALAQCEPAEFEAVAADCGFGRGEPHQPPDESGPMLARRPAPPPEPATPRPRPAPAKLRFLRAVAYERIEGAELEQQPPPEVGASPISPAELDARPYRLRPQPLQPWSRLWPWLHHVLGHRVPGSRIDIPKLVDRLARKQPVLKLPLRPNLAWTPQVHILIDDAAVMAPFRADIDMLLELLQRVRGREGLFCRQIPSEDVASINVDLHETQADWLGSNASLVNRSPPGVVPAAPCAGQTVLVISDLGCFDESPARMAAWLKIGRALQRNGIERFALSPCPRCRWDPRLARLWQCATWDRNERPPNGRFGRCPLPADLDNRQQHQMLDALLAVCSVALRIETPLLRELRLLLPGADAALEVDFLQHPAVVSIAGLCALRFDEVKRWQERIAIDANPLLQRLKRALPELLRRHHRIYNVLLNARETRNMHRAGLAISDDQLAAATEIFQRCIRWRIDEIETTAAGQPVSDSGGLSAWNERELARLSDTWAADDAELAAAAAYEDVARGDRETVQPPPNVNREVYLRNFDWGVRKGRRQQSWQLRWCGSDLELRAFNEETTPGTPLVSVPMFSPRLHLEMAQQEETVFQLMRTDHAAGRRCPLGTAAAVAASSDRCHIRFTVSEPPPWATRYGWDRWGTFADFVVEGVTFSLRWIPPGEFDMGSPDDELGRYDDESPQHRVTIGRGFWLGTTTVTQAQYAVVTGRSPSRFKDAGENAPVEQVSWDDAQAFLAELAAKVPDFKDGSRFRLPSEAEWEYACRAGAESALYNGRPLTTVDGRCPHLDELGWYSKNSDGRTHAVGAKLPNAWGLYDMLGNVWEWCQDVWHNNYAGAPVDGSAWETEGGDRVCRGGGWANGARGCRCAYRRYWLPDLRYRNVGFRLVLSRSSAVDDVRSS